MALLPAVATPERFRRRPARNAGTRIIDKRFPLMTIVVTVMKGKRNTASLGSRSSQL